MRATHPAVPTILLAFALNTAATAQESAPPMQKPVSLPAAGLELALPEGFQPGTVGEMYQVLQAGRADVQGKTVQGITVSAYPVDEGVTAEAYADQMVAQMKHSLVVRDLEVVKQTRLPVAQLEGRARLLRYNWRGKATVAAGAFFVREDKGSGARICYVITIESVEAHKASLLRYFGAVIETVKLVPLQHAHKAELGPPGGTWTSEKLGFAVTVPLGWHVTTTPTGVMLGRVDYLYGGVPTVALQVQTAPADPCSTAEACCEKQLARARQFAQRNEMDVKVVSQGETNLAGQPAQQFVLRQTPRQSDPAAEMPEDVTVVNRTISPLHHTYTLLLVCQGASPQQATTLMNALTPLFNLTPPADPADGSDDAPGPPAPQPR
jgi:hypothetical protein